MDSKTLWIIGGVGAALLIGMWLANRPTTTAPGLATANVPPVDRTGSDWAAGFTAVTGLVREGVAAYREDRNRSANTTPAQNRTS